jgi:sulfite reductase (NADPH) flavoprotein alpha-component
MLDAEETRVAFGEEPGRRAIRLLRRFVDEANMADIRPETMFADFFAGRLGIMMESTAQLARVTREIGGRFALRTVRYPIGARDRLGVASTYFAERLPEGRALRVYVQKAHGFALPADAATPIIMVGPGTGVAPFRAFLQERLAAKAQGGAWLFFGHQREACDFFYREEFEELMAAGALTRLSTAWSRDAAPKVYVQDRMREAGADVWDWLQRGAHVYICGDVKRMAKDVETTLAAIAVQHGVMGEDDARKFIVGLKKTGRYQADVY